MMAEIDLYKLLDEIADVFVQIVYNWRNKHKDGFGEMNGSAQCLLQMIALELKSILKLNATTNFNVSGVNCQVLDAVTMQNTLRTIYETTTIFYYIFTKTQNEKERELLFLIWRMKGMQNRQGLSVIPNKYQEKQEKEAKGIGDDIKRTKAIAKSLDMSVKAYNRICSIVDNKSHNVCGYEFIKDSNGRIIDFAKRSFGCKEQAKEILGDEGKEAYYRFLSMYVHPSYLGVLQFGQMYNSDFIKKMSTDALYFAIALSGKIIRYFVSSIDGGQDAVDSLSNDQRFALEIATNILP